MEPLLIESSRDEAFRALEAERKKLAEFLLEDISQLLFAIKLQYSENGREEHIQVDEAIRRIRILAFTISPQILERFGLKVGLTELVRLSDHQNIPYFEANLNTLPENLHGTTNMAIFRLVQTIFDNVHRDDLKTLKLNVLTQRSLASVRASLETNEKVQNSVAGDLWTKSLTEKLEATTRLTKGNLSISVCTDSRLDFIWRCRSTVYRKLR